jgi:hypothetical protein
MELAMAQAFPGAARGATLIIAAVQHLGAMTLLSRAKALDHENTKARKGILFRVFMLS